MEIYELTPKDGRKSFYGKAKVVVDNDGIKTLYSYGTPICRINKDRTITKLWQGWTATTGRHIATFLGINKAEWMALS